jgi:hypothetical protein
MRLMGISALYPRRRTSKPGKGHKIYPYLLKDLSIDRPNQVWASDISAPWRWRQEVYADKIGWFSTGDWNVTPFEGRIRRKGAVKLRWVPTAGLNEQNGLNCTGCGLPTAGRATTGSMVRQRSMRQKPLYLEANSLWLGRAERMWSDSVRLDVPN